MKVIEPLMTEHRLIERMVDLMDTQVARASTTGAVDSDFIALAVDFLRSYADRTHHGKEEDILFRDLAQKQLSPDDTKMMQELASDHTSGRGMVTRLLNANKLYSRGNKEELTEILDCARFLIRFYPSHIAKEEMNFFYPSLKYLTEEEQDKMLERFWEFDRQVIHEKYRKIVENAETHTA